MRGVCVDSLPPRRLKGPFGKDWIFIQQSAALWYCKYAGRLLPHKFHRLSGFKPSTVLSQIFTDPSAMKIQDLHLNINLSSRPQQLREQAVVEEDGCRHRRQQRWHQQAAARQERQQPSRQAGSGQASRSSQRQPRHPGILPKHPGHPLPRHPGTLPQEISPEIPQHRTRGCKIRTPQRENAVEQKSFGVWCDLFCMTHNLLIISVWLWTTFAIVHHSHERMTLFGTLADVQETPSAVCSSVKLHPAPHACFCENYLLGTRGRRSLRIVCPFILC